MLAFVLVLALSFLGYLQESENIAHGEVALKIVTLGNTTIEVYNYSGTIRNLLLQDHNATGKYRLECLDDVCESSELAWEIRVNEKLISKSYQSRNVGDKDFVLVSLN